MGLTYKNGRKKHKLIRCVLVANSFFPPQFEYQARYLDLKPLKEIRPFDKEIFKMRIIEVSDTSYKRDYIYGRISLQALLMAERSSFVV